MANQTDTPTVVLLPCLRCEGTGIVRYYLNRAGDYEKRHCPQCLGQGKAEYEGPQLADAYLERNHG